ncbi:MAG: hypothetical protein ACK5Q8_07475 [Phycisphaerales bacterium]|jgi:hypothetical protein|nr:hypothetical protein [Phycisphaeraceae bacterium]
MASHEDRRIVAEFLGRGIADAWGPGRHESLLGLEPGQTDADSVRTALSQRLMVLAFHPRAQSPEADRLRTLLELAAQRLAPASALPHEGHDVVADIRVAEPITPRPAAPQPAAEHPDLQARQIAELLGLSTPATIESFDGHAVAINDGSAPSPELSAADANAPDAIADDAAGAEDLGPIELDIPASDPLGTALPEPNSSSFTDDPSPDTAHPRAAITIPEGTLVLTGIERAAGALLSRSGGVTPALLHELGLLALQRGLPVSATEIALRNVATIMAHPMIPVIDAPPGYFDQPGIAHTATAPAPITRPKPRHTPQATLQSAPQAPLPFAPVSAPAVAPVSAPVSAPISAPISAPRAAQPANPYDTDTTMYRRPEDVLLSRFLIAGAAVVVLAVVGIILLIVLSSRSSTSAPLAGAPGGAPAPTPGGQPAAQPTPATSTHTNADPDRGGVVDAAAFIRQLTGARVDPGTRPEPADVIARLRQSADDVAANPAAALSEFEQAARSVRFWWPTFGSPERIACVNSIVDFVLRMPDDPAIVRRAIAALTTRVTLEPPSGRAAAIDPADVQPAIWSSGVLARLSRERDIPSALRNEIQRAVAEMYPGEPLNTPDFAGGTARALRAMPRRLLGPAPDPSSTAAPATPAGRAPAELAKRGLEKWLEALLALSPTSRPGRDPAEVLIEPATQRELLSAIELIMLASPDVTLDPAAFELLGDLVSRVRFREGSPGQAQLVAWLDDQHMTSPNLAVVTRVAVNGTQIEGVGPAMVLAPAASTSERATVRDEYIRAWSIAVGGAVADLGAQFTRVTTERLARTAPPDAPPIEDLRLAVGFALMNRAVYQRDRGQNEDARASLTQDAPEAVAPSLLPSLANPAAGDSWAVRYLGSDRSLAVRLERLKELETAGISSRADGDVLAEIAFLAPVPELRSAAQKLCIKFSDRIEVIDGLLKVLPRAPRSRIVVDTVQRVTNRPVAPASSPRWMLDARRALVAKALEVMASNDPRTGPDALAADLASAYQVCAGIEPSGSTVQIDDAPAVALAAVEKLQRDLLTQARALVPNDAAPIRLDEIERRRTGRLMVATGPIQQFAAEQVTCAELVAFIVTARIPARSDQAKVILDEMHQSRNAARHIFTQIHACERAMSRLWLLFLQPRESQS